MRYRDRVLGFLLSVLIFGSSCSGWLEEIPINTITEEQAWQTGSDAEGAVAAAFGLFRRSLGGLTAEDTPATTRWGAWGDYCFWGDCRSGDWIAPGGDSDWIALFENRLIEKTALNPLNNWRLFYRTIEQCNLSILNIPDIAVDITDDRKNELIAEARFMRAMSHFYASRIWGDIPINTTARNVEPIGRSPQEEVMRLVVSEVSDIVDILPWRYTDSNDQVDMDYSTTRGSKGAALALLAHAHMWLEEYQEASDAIDKIIQSGTYEILPISFFREIFDEGGSSEMIFEMFYDKEYGEFSGYYGHALTWFVVNPYTSRDVLSVAIPKSKIFELFPEYEIDKRIPELFQSADRSVNNSEIRPIFDDPLQNGEEEIMFAKFRKAKDRSYDFMESTVPVFRYAGLLLLKAEADARLGNGTAARDNINIIRERAGLPLLVRSEAEVLIEEALEERRRELLGESSRSYDLVRLGRLHEFNENITEQDEQQGAGYFPVDPEAFVNNPEMEQSYYWQFNQ